MTLTPAAARGCRPATSPALTSVSSAARRAPAPWGPKMQERIGAHAHGGNRPKVDSKTQQPLLEDRMVREAKHQSSAQPDRENGELDGCRDANQVSTSGVIGARKAGRYAITVDMAKLLRGFLKPANAIVPPSINATAAPAATASTVLTATARMPFTRRARSRLHRPKLMARACERYGRNSAATTMAIGLSSMSPVASRMPPAAARPT